MKNGIDPSVTLKTVMAHRAEKIPYNHITFEFNLCMIYGAGAIAVTKHFGCKQTCYAL
jgi:hypothetical protein